MPKTHTRCYARIHRKIACPILVFMALGLASFGPSRVRSAAGDSHLTDGIFIYPNEHVEKNFGDLSIHISLDSSGQSACCTLYLASVPVGINTLVRQSPDYSFDVQLANTSACGVFTLQLLRPPRVSKLNGHFCYSSASNHQDYCFKGDLAGWKQRR